MIHRIAPDTVEIKRVYTAPTARGLGLGRRIVETALDHARRTAHAEWCSIPCAHWWQR